MQTQIILSSNGKLYIVQILVMQSNGCLKWETVDSTPYEGKEKRLRDYIQRAGLTQVNEVYKSEFYQKWIESKY